MCACETDLPNENPIEQTQALPLQSLQASCSPFSPLHSGHKPCYSPTKNLIYEFKDKQKIKEQASPFSLTNSKYLTLLQIVHTPTSSK